ncbi:MAG: hypothetical protein O9262_06190 [Cyclobacteriaceae bacterium]|nr:hypothetical protein [Cyclobacteriaceae bacterium]
MNKFNLDNSYKAVVIGGSAGSFQGMIKILSQLPKNFPLPIIMALHRLKHVRHGFVEALSLKSVAPVTEPNDKEAIKKGRNIPGTCELSYVSRVGTLFCHVHRGDGK